MSPGVAYTFLALTMRMAFSISLQSKSLGFTPAGQYARNDVWCLLAWKSSQFIISYGRPNQAKL
jgi:hypothetical protein